MEGVIDFFSSIKEDSSQSVMKIWISSEVKFCMQIRDDFSKLSGNFVMQMLCTQLDKQTYDTNRNMQTLTHCASNTIKAGEGYPFRIDL